jgi:discoidin domain receptor family protein 2
MIEYWQSSVGKWQRYSDKNGNEIVVGNKDTTSIVKQMLETPIVAKLLRIIPVSERPRTICLRFELYGCELEDRGGGNREGTNENL